ncbi:MAG TPA: NAD(+)/NADH kinase [Terriglobales bacterium]|nr:NAD(+)/NADH kinase [Terriglobales bacterium]
MPTGYPSQKIAGIVSKPEKPELARVVPDLINWLEAHHYEVVTDHETAVYTAGSNALPRLELARKSPQFVIVLGGDGTLLAAARAVAKACIPILGVNLGTLGFLTEVPLEQMYSTLAAIDEGRCESEPRSMVHCEVMRAGSCVAQYDALNDLVLGKSTIARLNHCDVYVDRVFVASYKADSLIVSSPTGSTAYSLAAGGPILMPSVAAFVITPVSAHALTHRPLVVRDTSEIEIVVKTGEEEAYLSIDGQVGMPMYDGDRILCRKSAYCVQLLRLEKNFFDVLRTKLKWGQR